MKRQNVPLARDVIFLAESGEEGSTQVGIQFMVDNHFDAINAEYCLAEGANVRREGGRVKYASVQMLEKLPRAIELTSRGVAGHGSVPLKTNAIVHLSGAVASASPSGGRPSGSTTSPSSISTGSRRSPRVHRRRRIATCTTRRPPSSADDYFLKTSRGTRR